MRAASAVPFSLVVASIVRGYPPDTERSLETVRSEGIAECRYARRASMKLVICPRSAGETQLPSMFSTNGSNCSAEKTVSSRSSVIW